MRIRTVYLKVRNLAEAKAFWQKFLNVAPRKDSERWCEFAAGDTNFALLLLDEGEEPGANSCVPVFEYSGMELPYYIDKAKGLGAAVVYDGLKDPNVQGIVLRDPLGNEFELTEPHA